MKGDKGYIIFFFLSCYLIFAVISIGYGKIQLDEREFHIPTAKSFYSKNIADVIQGNEYKTASTPLPYIITAFVHRLVGAEPKLQSVRVVNIVVSIFTTAVLIWLLNSLKIPGFPYIAVMFFYPYFLKPSFTFHMAGYGLFFYVLFLKYIDEEGIMHQILSGLALCFAVLSQQFYLVMAALPVAVILFRGKDSVPLDRGLISICVVILCLSPAFILFYFWGGLTHPNFRTWGVQFSVHNLTGVLSVLGITFLPVILSELKKIDRKLMVIFLGLSIILSVFFFPTWSEIPGPGVMPGMTFNLLERISVFSSLTGYFAKSLLIFMGISSLFVMIRNKFSNPVLLSALMLIVVAFSINKIPSERHMLPLVATAMIIMFPSVKPSYARDYWLPYQAMIGITYFFYMMFLTAG